MYVNSFLDETELTFIPTFEVAQAIRIAQLEGLHTQLPEEALGSDTVARCRKLWWTLYIMDRHFSCSLGVPMNKYSGY